MKFLKKLALGLFLATATVGTSSVAFAFEEGRTSFSPAQAIEMVEAQIKIAQDAITAGYKQKEIADLIKEAKDLSKEINANDKVDVKRQRANAHLKKARSAAKKGEMEKAAEHLNNAAKGFAELKGLL